jgi:hypothetical protein
MATEPREINAAAMRQRMICQSEDTLRRLAASDTFEQLQTFPARKHGRMVRGEKH